MPDSSELIRNILHYQKSLDRYSLKREDAKILHCIFKLFNMPITVSHLEQTGIGRTVNSLRKLGGEVEDAAKTLVRKWKQMVSGIDEGDEPQNNDANRESKSNSSHKHSDKYRNSDKQEKSSKDSKYNHSRVEKYNDRSSPESRSNSPSDRYDEDEDDDEDRHSYKSEDCESGVASVSEQSSLEEEAEDEIVPKNNKYERDMGYIDKFHSTPSSSAGTSNSKREMEKERKRERSHSRDKTGKRESHSDEEHRKRRKYDRSSSESSEELNYTHTSRDKSTSKRKHDHSASDEEIKKKTSRKSPPRNDSHRSSSSHRDKDSSHKHKKESKSESENNHSKSSYKSSSSRDHKKDNSRSDSNKRDSKNSSKDDSKNEKRKSESIREERSKSEDKSKKELSPTKSDKKNSDKEKSKNKHSSGSNKYVDIGSGSGTSFAEALGMLEPTTSKKSDKKSKSHEKVSHKQDKPEKSYKEKVVEKPWKSDKEDILIPPPPPKADIDINIASLLPSITPNYRPVANPFVDSGNSRNKIMNDDEALSLVMSQKNLRTKVYSGNKIYFDTVPSLFDLCLRVLQDNIDALEYTGGVPYSILKPVLDKATPDQLYMLEHHNPYLIDDSDEIWQFHCQKEFRNKKREEMESWREMYMRCLDERETKLRTLTKNIKFAQDTSIPVRQTKLAYVDSVVKPPRDVIRKQIKSGIADKKPVITPTARLAAIATSGAAGQIAVPNPVKASSSGGSSAAAKPKKAPLMAKTLQFLKGNRFRR